MGCNGRQEEATHATVVLIKRIYESIIVEEFFLKEFFQQKVVNLSHLSFYHRGMSKQNPKSFSLAFTVLNQCRNGCTN